MRVHITSAANVVSVGGQTVYAMNGSDGDARSNQAIIGASVGKSKKTRKNFSKRQRC